MGENSKTESLTQEHHSNVDAAGDASFMDWRIRALFVALVVALYFAVGVFNHDVWAPTEPTTSGIVWNMYERGELAVPRVNDLAHLEKPPLYYWMAWGAFKLAGHMSPGLLRLPAAILGTLCLVVIFLTARKRFGEGAAWLSVLAGATTFVFYEISHRASADVSALLFSFLCLGIFANTLDGPGVEKRALLWHDLLLAFLLAASFYAKNLYVFLIVLPPVCMMLLMKRQFRRILLITAASAFLLALLLLPWCMALYREGGWRYLRVVFVDNAIGRFWHISPPVFAADVFNDAFAAEKCRNPFFYILPLVLMTQPWFLITVAAVVGLFKKRDTGDFELFLKTGLITVPLALTLSSSKANEYLLPVSFFLFLIIGDFFRDCIEGRLVGGWRRLFVAINLVSVALLLLAPPIALAVITKNWLYILIELPCIAGLAAIVRLCRGDYWSRSRLTGSISVAALVITLTLAFAYPALNDEKTCRYFFEDIKKEMVGRRTCIAFRNDRELPGSTYYLRMRLPVVSEQDIPKLLLSGDDIGVIMSAGYYRDNKAIFDSIPHVLVRTSRGKNIFVYVATPKAREADNKEKGRATGK